MIKHIFILLYFLFPPLLIASEINHPVTIHKYNMQDGLSNDIVYGICQDIDGCIWFATAEGISKYDGSDFSSFTWPQNSLEMSNHQALKILYCQNRIYVATNFGLMTYDMEKDEFKFLLPEGIEKMKIKALAYSRDGNIWVGSYEGQGVYKYNIEDETFTSIWYHHTDSRIISLYEDKEGYLYVGTHFAGVDIVDPQTGNTINYNVDGTTNMPHPQVEKIIEDSFGNIWFGTWGGLVLYDKEKRELKTFRHTNLSNCQINALVEDQSGNLWVGTETGLISFSIREAIVNPVTFKTEIYHETQDEYGLSYRTVLDIHCDFENNIWIATNSGGVNFISRFQPKFSRIVYDPRLKNSLSYRRVTSVSEDKIGNLWIATDGGGINYYDKIGKRITAYNSSNSNLMDDAVLCSLVDSDGDVWFGTYNNTLNRKRAGQNQFTIYQGSQHEENTLMGGDLLCIEEDDYKRIWIGQRSGLVCFDKANETFTQVPELRWTSTCCIFPTKDGIYIGAQPKVFFYDFVTGEVTTPHPVFETLFTNCMFVDEDEMLWIGTNGQGLFCYDPKTKHLKNFNVQSGLPSNNICKILKDNEHNLWISTTKGISKIMKEGKGIQSFTSKDGVQSGMFIENSGTKTRSGQLIFGGTEGVTIFNPAEITKDLQHPNVILTKFSLFNVPVEVRSATNPDSPLEKNINYVDEITLKYDESVFSIEYASVDYRSTNQTHYAYILEGADKEWNYVNNNSATYRYLAPGSYVFKVMASNLDGVFDTSHYRSVKINIQPPFYLTWWAYILYFLIFCLICYLIWNFMTVRSRALNRIRYERLERQKSEELHQEKLLFFTNISHELKTPLTLIAAPVDRLLKEETSEERKYLLALIKRNVVRLLNNINQIIDLRKIDREQMKLKVKEMDVIAFVGEVVDLFRDMAQSKNIDLQYSHTDEELTGWISPEFLDKILCNLLSNALKFTPDHGEIIIDVFTIAKDSPEERQLCIEITDTGKGISAKNLPHIFERFYQEGNNKPEAVGIGSGIGLHLVKSLVELHKGEIQVDSKIGIGTRFTLTFPYTAESYLKHEKSAPDYVYYHKEQLSAIAVGPDIAQQETTRNNHHGNKLLIIDDDTEILSFLKYELRNDYDVIIAENGKIGLEKACETIPDLIISDVMMPDMDGITVCKELKNNINTSHIPVILLTAKSSVDDRIEGLEVGADSYIPKPFDIRHLRVRIKKLIEVREVIRTKYVAKLSDKTQEKPKGISEIDEQLLQKIEKYIKSNISDPDVNGEVLARQVNMSRMSLHRKLKALTGLSAGDFVRNIRLEEARKLLEAGGKTVSEIAYDVGYSSPSYFYTCFIKKFGMPPSEMNAD